MTNGQTRRGILRRGGAGLAAIGTTALAGCASELPLIGDGDGDEDDSEPAIEAWLTDPEPADFLRESYEVRDREFRERNFRYQDPSVVFDNDDRLSYDDLWGRLVRDAVNVPAMDLDWQLVQHVDWWLDLVHTDSGANVTERVRPEVHVLAGSLDPDAIAAHLEDESTGDVVAAGTAHGFDLYELGSFRFALRDDFAVRTLSDVWIDSDAVLEYVLAARWDGGDSDGPRRWADDDHAGPLLAERGSGQFSNAAVFPPRDPTEEPAYDWEWQTGLVGTARSLAVDGETTTVTDAFCYESADDAALDALEGFVETNRDIDDGAFPTLEEYTVERSSDAESVLVLTGTARTSAIVGSNGPEPDA
ncbi:hypothetical protein C488_13786 [Natrinema pellirubrum DSM 15624]|uniref:Lipoprotein n=1 Tax=Natrinema pellirubrum (strain DSM 15624 / CIP 106293 / JCM 10476 / NCIMB 786 / 157) TaxID=797303 RepID=L0JJT6_NATP1|nr:hypothetical protein [Natrinema pellirubrum]AGB31544.1 hypothetical protein Natpe_1647 [Natrinema pellirubrum DSM 15624]ELY73334.1 hypothetical protein C488_13786 [Natrinema pellirubrum DSM 15624]